MKLDEEPELVYKDYIFLLASMFLAPEINGHIFSIIIVLQHKIIKLTEMD